MGKRKKGRKRHKARGGQVLLPDDADNFASVEKASQPLLGRHTALAALVLVLASTALYGRTLSFGFTHVDDGLLITQDAAFLQDFGNAPKLLDRRFFAAGGSRGRGYYRPLVTLSYMIDVHFSGASGEHTASFRVTNLLFHTLSALLLCLLLQRLGQPFAVASIASLIFALHPALTQAVAWIPGRCDTMLAAFGLGSLLAFLGYLQRRSRALLALHAVLFLAALWSKEAAIVFPLIAGLLLLLMLADRRRQVLRDPLLWAAWLVPISIWLLGVRRAYVDSPQDTAALIRTALANVGAIFMHLGKIVFPAHLSVLATVEDTSWIGGAIAAVALVAGAFVLSARERRLWYLGAAWFLLFVLPGLPASDYMILENRLYLPTVGVLLGLLPLLARLRRWRPGAQLDRALVVGGVLLAVGLGVLTWRYSASFADRFAFTDNATRTSPRSPIAHLYRGNALMARNDDVAAEKAYLRAFDLDRNLPTLLNNLGVIYLNRGETQRAEGFFRAEISINPRSSTAHHRLGLALERLGRRPQAIAAFRQAVALNPANSEALGALARYQTR